VQSDNPLATALMPVLTARLGLAVTPNIGWEVKTHKCGPSSLYYGFPACCRDSLSLRMNCQKSRSGAWATASCFVSVTRSQR
jgi:hypothetical protein